MTRTQRLAVVALHPKDPACRAAALCRWRGGDRRRRHLASLRRRRPRRRDGLANELRRHLVRRGATSLPELVVTVSALCIGALDMAISNLFGSNLFDMAIIAVDDILFADGPILAHVSPIHAVLAMSAVVMTGIAVIGLSHRPRMRVFRAVGRVSLGLFVMYLLNTYILYIETQ